MVSWEGGEVRRYSLLDRNCICPWMPWHMNSIACVIVANGFQAAIWTVEAWDTALRSLRTSPIVSLSTPHSSLSAFRYHLSCLFRSLIRVYHFLLRNLQNPLLSLEQSFRSSLVLPNVVPPELFTLGAFFCSPTGLIQREDHFLLQLLIACSLFGLSFPPVCLRKRAA